MIEPLLLPAFNPGPMTGDGNNTYLLIGANRLATLVDAGVGDARHLAAIDAALIDRGATLVHVLVTHAHSDHARGAQALAAAYPRARFRKRLWPEEDAKFPAPWEPLEEGESVRVGDDHLTVLLTPGHSPDHVALWHEASRTALTGDLVVSGTSVMIAASRGGDLVEYLASLERIRALDALRLLPAHGPEITRAESVLARYVEHRLRREAQILAELAAGRGSVQAITESIYHGLPSALVPAAAENVRAHLEKLRREGRATCQHDHWTAK